MSKAKQAWPSLCCLLMLLTNGAGVLAQQQQPEKKIVTSGQGRVVIMTMPPEGERKIGANSLLIRSDEGDGIGFQGNFTYFTNEMSFDGEVVKGAPYAAEAVTETVQTLSDGNRIVRKSRALLYRDGEGRTRREQTLNNVGPFATSGDAPHMIFINDPVGGANYVLDPRTHIARKATMFASGFNTFTYKVGPPPPGMELMGPPPPDGSLPMKPLPPPGGARNDAVKRVQPEYPPVAKAAGAQGSVSVQVVIDEQGNVTSARATSGHPLLHQASVDAARQWVFKPTLINGKPVKVSGVINFSFVLDKEGETAPAPGPPPQPKFQEVKESLGRQTIEGLDAEGTRSTVTIPAGEIGNERPISVVTERWYAPELQSVVLSKHSDPRFGETIYRLININRGEPARNLFEVPPDFQLKQGDLMKKEVRMRRDKNEP